MYLLVFICLWTIKFVDTLPVMGELCPSRILRWHFMPRRWDRSRLIKCVQYHSIAIYHKCKCFDFCHSFFSRAFEWLVYLVLNPNFFQMKLFSKPIAKAFLLISEGNDKNSHHLSHQFMWKTVIVVTQSQPMISYFQWKEIEATGNEMIICNR